MTSNKESHCNNGTMPLKDNADVISLLVGIFDCETKELGYKSSFIMHIQNKLFTLQTSSTYPTK